MIEMNIEQRISELERLCQKAKTEIEYEDIKKIARELEEDMIGKNYSIEEIAAAMLPSCLAEYHWIRKFAKIKKGKKSVEFLYPKISKYLNKIRRKDLKIYYGFVLATIIDDLEILGKDSKEDARKMYSNVRTMAETEDLASYLRIINEVGVLYMKHEEFVKALAILSRMEEISGISPTNIPEDSIRYAGNILNNMGACNIRGSIDVPEGIICLGRALKFYRAEKESSLVYLKEIKLRLNEAYLSL